MDQVPNAELHQAVMDFAVLTRPFSEKDLERDWKWKDHDEEGIRFAFFVTLQELRHLAVRLSSVLHKPTAAQHILSQYHTAYMDLQAAVLGVSNADAERSPTEGEWSVKRTYAHILGTDIGFSAVVRYALEGHRANHWKPDPIPEEEYPRLDEISDEEFDALRAGPFDNMLTFHHGLHTRIIEEFRTISDAELELPSTFWEETRFPIQHRLHRYEAHFVQHTIQTDKTLVAIGLAPTESKRLLRRIYAALAEVEGLMILAERVDDAMIHSTASSISERTKEIQGLLSR